MKPKAFNVLNAALAVVLATATGAAHAGPPTPGDNFNCQKVISAALDACNANNDVADGDKGVGSYLGSCVDGGRCDDSVYNKLLSASGKIGAGKLQGACDNLASIQSDLWIWLGDGTAKPKIDQLGYATISAKISELQGMYSCR